MKTFGKVDFDAKTREWVIQPHPHVMTRLKRVFERIPKHAHGKARLSDTPENARELKWFLDRYPMEVPETVQTGLDNTAQQHSERESTISKMLEVGYEPRTFKLAVPLRSYQQLAADVALASKQLLLADDVGLGKAQPDDALVLTPDGWTRIDALEVGLTIVDPDGGWARVTGVFPQGERNVFEVLTSDGAVTRCCDEHLWTIQTSEDRAAEKTRTVPTAFIRGYLRANAARKTNGKRAHRIFLPSHSPAFFSPLPKRLPLDPYILGVLLGDGSIASGPVEVEKHDQDLHDHIRNRLPPRTKLVPTTEPFRSRIVAMDGTRYSRVFEAIDSLGLVGCRAWEKHIPEQYLRASEKDRWALLRGLMDTDGECDARSSHCVYTTTSPQLCNAFVELVRSLGGIAKACYRPRPQYKHKGQKKTGRPAWRIRINVPQCPFTIARKKERWRKTRADRYIVSIRKVGKTHTRCIRVSSKRSLYFTNGFIPTHNTASAIAALSDPSTRPALVVTLTHLPQQFAAEIDRFLPGLRVHILRGTQPYDVTDVWSGRKRKEREKAMPDVIITSYSRISGWAETLAPLIKSVTFDEVHELRHGDTQKYTAAKHLRENASYCTGLSATPINGYGSEIWYVMNIIAPGLLGTRAEFLREHCGKEEIGSDDDVVMLRASGGDKKAQLADPAAFGEYLTSSGLMLRRTRKEVGRELPPIQRIPYIIDCDPDEIREANTTAADLAKIILSQSADPTSRFNASGRLDALIRQATGVAKAPYVAEFVKMLLEQGEKVVLFGWHKEVYSIWREKLAEFNPVWYTGDEDAKEKGESKRKFCEGESNLLILSLRSGAGLDGLQYTGCRIVVFGELDWSEAQHEQAEGRVARDGQNESVACYYLLANAGSDPIIVDVLGLKRRQLEGIRNPNAPKMALKQTAVDDRARRLAASLLQRLDPQAYEKIVGSDVTDVAQTTLDFTTLVDAHVSDGLAKGEKQWEGPPAPISLTPPPTKPVVAPRESTKPPSAITPPPKVVHAKTNPDVDPRKPGPVTRPALPHQAAPVKSVVAPIQLPAKPPMAQPILHQPLATQAKPPATLPMINMDAWKGRVGVGKK